MSFLFEIADVHALSFCSTPNTKPASIFKKSTSLSAVPSVAPSASTTPSLVPIVAMSSSSSSSSSTATSRISEQHSQSQQPLQAPPLKAHPMTSTSSNSSSSSNSNSEHPHNDHHSLKVPQTTFLGWTPPSSPWMRPTVTDEEHMNKLVSFQL